jgi:hypothetical protein
MRRISGYTWTDYKTNTQIAKWLKITPILDKLLEYKRNWIQHVNRTPRNRLHRVIKHYCPTGRRNHPNWQKESWQIFEETSGYVRPERVNKWPTPWQIYYHYCEIPSDISIFFLSLQRTFLSKVIFRRCRWVLSCTHFLRVACLY